MEDESSVSVCDAGTETEAIEIVDALDVEPVVTLGGHIPLFMDRTHRDNLRMNVRRISKRRFENIVLFGL